MCIPNLASDNKVNYLSDSDVSKMYDRHTHEIQEKGDGIVVGFDESCLLCE